MKKIELKSRNLLRTIFGGISFTAMAFVFQACYGTGTVLMHQSKALKLLLVANVISALPTRTENLIFMQVFRRCGFAIRTLHN